MSPNGGRDPLFSKDSRELYHWEDTRLMTLRLEGGSAFTPKPPQMLFDGRNLNVLNAVYDVARDGRFLMVKMTDKPPKPSPIELIANWSATLPR